MYVIYKKRIGEPERHWLLNIPTCESGWDPSEVEPSSEASGLYQFEPATWATTPYARKSVFSARWNSLAASWLYEKDGGGREWECKV